MTRSCYCSALRSPLASEAVESLDTSAHIKVRALDFVGGWEAAGNPGSGLGVGLLIAGVAAFLLLVPLAVFLCLRGSSLAHEDVPAVRWMIGSRMRAFAGAAAAGDFTLADRIADEIMRRSGLPAPFTGT